MPPVTLEGDTLGEKRRHFNKLVEDAITDKHYELCNIRADNSDIDNLLKIDIACKTRNVDYIMEVMKSTDMLYAATAIKKSTWLITEQQYAHIINPEYLHTQLLPSMNPKSFNKLMLHIRLNLKDETRVETFYEYLKETDSAYKWLERCSIPFIENVLKNGRLIPLSLYKRLCKRSAHFLPYYGSVESQYEDEVKQAMLLLLKSHTTEVLNLVEDKTKLDYVPEMGKKKTKFLMKKCTTRVLDNFDKYADKIDLSTVAKYLKRNEIKPFLYKHGSTLVGSRCFDRNTLKNFIKNMPAEERFEFTKSTFIDKTQMGLQFTDKEKSTIERYVNLYQWYEVAPFDVAFPEIKTLIRKEMSSSERCAMLSVLITCTQNKLQHIKTLLIFYHEKHVNEPLKFKIRFVNNLLSQTSSHEFDAETWNVLDQLFHSMDVYTEPNYSVQRCLYSIVAYKVLHDEPVPEIVEENMLFDSFESLQSKLNEEQNKKLFTYLFNFILSKIQSNDITNESDAEEHLIHLENSIRLLRDWNKNICEFPVILEEIQKFIQIVHKNTWDTNMTYLYNINKSWRKHMFEESLSLSLCEETCLNALKHKPQLLARHDKEIDALRADDAVLLRRLLARLRVYWPHSLAQQWTDAYLLKHETGQAVLKGLFVLLSQSQIVDFAKTHAPDNFQITWGETDQTEIKIRKNIAKNLHLARPLIPLDAVLWYAKGDYLQFTVPSLNAILHYMSEVESLKHFTKLLDGSVSLQKFGLHLTFNKFKSDVLKSVFSKTWKTTKNLTIRSVIFKHTVDQICKVKNPTVEKDLWELLRTFMDELTSGESAEIYKKMGKAEKVPISIRGEYFTKSYEFLTSLPESANCKKNVTELVQSAPKIVESLDEDFVANKLLSQAGHKLCMYNSEFIEVLACYVIFGEKEEDQLNKFRRVVGPAIEEVFHSWGNMTADDYYVRDNFDKFLTRLIWSFITKVTTNKIPIPAKLFKEIKTKIEHNLPILENYVLYTSWKLITVYVEIIHAYPSCLKALESSKWTEADFTDKWRSSAVGDAWKDINLQIAPLFGPIIVKCLREDIEQYSPTVFCLFAEALQAMFRKLNFQHNLFVLETLKYMLNSEDFVYSYLVVSNVISKYSHIDELKSIRSEICKKLKSSQSKTVLVHYYNDFCNIVE